MPMPRQAPFWPALIVTVISLAAALSIAVRHMHMSAQQTTRLSRLENENRDLRARSEKIAREMEALRQGLALAPAGPPESPRPAHPSRAGQAPTASEDAMALAQLRTDLSSANTSITHMQARIQELEAASRQMTEENKRLTASEADLNEKVGSTSRVLEAVQNELKGKEERLTQLEGMNVRLRDENRTSRDKITQISRLLRDLEELNRRRETYLSNILRRYRDITDQYRALSGRLEKPQDNPLAGSPELSRIQNTISMTEEDLRQLSSLNAQAVRLQQKIARSP